MKQEAPRAHQSTLPAYGLYNWIQVNLIYRIFGKYTKALFQLGDLLFLVAVFLLQVRKSLRDPHVFIFERPFVGIVNGLKELDSFRAFFWIHRLFLFGLGAFFSSERHRQRYRQFYDSRLEDRL